MHSIQVNVGWENYLSYILFTLTFTVEDKRSDNKATLEGFSMSSLSLMLANLIECGVNFHGMFVCIQVF